MLNEKRYMKLPTYGEVSKILLSAGLTSYIHRNDEIYRKIREQ
jgi:hypothetical protein